MAWTIEYTATAKSQLRRLDRQAARRIVDYMDSRLVGRDDPRALGKALTGPLGGLWRYRVGSCRVICDIQATYPARAGLASFRAVRRARSG